MKKEIKKSNITIISSFLLFSLAILFYSLLNFYFEKEKEEIMAYKKDVAYKVLRNSIALLNFYNPVELYLDHTINKSEFLKFSELNIKFCNNRPIKPGHYFLYYDEKKRCIKLLNSFKIN